MIEDDGYYVVELSYNTRGFFISLYSVEGGPLGNKVLEIEN